MTHLIARMQATAAQKAALGGVLILMARKR
jgi:hypothetical protein